MCLPASSSGFCQLSIENFEINIFAGQKSNNKYVMMRLRKVSFQNPWTIIVHDEKLDQAAGVGIQLVPETEVISQDKVLTRTPLPRDTVLYHCAHGSHPQKKRIFNFLLGKLASI